MSNQKVDALNVVVQRLTGVKQVLVNVELGQQPVESYEALSDVEKSIEILEIIKASLFWEDMEREAQQFAPTEEWDEVSEDDPRVSTQIHFLDVEQLQYFVAEYEHYNQEGATDIFFKSFISDYSLAHLDRVKFDLERNRNEALAGINYDLEPEYKYTTCLIDEIVENINTFLNNNDFYKIKRNNA